MKKTIHPEVEDYKSTLHIGIDQAPYGKVYTYADGGWLHRAYNKQDWQVGECWWIEWHGYRINL